MEPKPLTFSTPAGLTLAAEAYGPDTGPPVLLAHGGGQTRHAWRRTAAILAGHGWYAVAVDLRGHGESGWAADGDYRLDAFAEDLLAVAGTFARAPAVIGASLGGVASLLGEGELAGSGRRGFSALVLVDVTPRVQRDRAARILGFMGERAEEGFATLEEAADAIAAYLPHRPRPPGLDGLRKNLRAGADGRFRWHWDPKFVTGDRGPMVEEQAGRLTRATARIGVPMLLVRGASSEVVDEAGVDEFLALAPHARAVSVAGARHMVAGDENDAFTGAVLPFLAEVAAGRAVGRQG